VATNAMDRMAQKKRNRPGDNHVGARIRLRRIELKMSQMELSRRVGVSLPQITRYEEGRNEISASRLQALATALEVRPAFFFGQRKQSRAVETALLLDTDPKARLATAFSRIPDRVIQQHVVRLVESLQTALTKAKRGDPH
jgi:transcriptional regulator with XRE-family HTH domain